MSEPQADTPEYDSDTQVIPVQSDTPVEADVETEAVEQEDFAVPVYDERLHFRYFVTSNRLVWGALAIILMVGLLWSFVSRAVSRISDVSVPVTPVEADPTDQLAKAASDIVDAIMKALGDALVALSHELFSDVSISIGGFGWMFALAVVVVLGVMTFRSWMIWSRSRLIVDEEGVRLVEADIPWLLVTGAEKPLDSSIVNGLAKSRDILDQLIFRGCWHASILADEQAGRHDEVQNVPVRDVDRLEVAVNALAAQHANAIREGEQTTNQLLAEAVRELRRIRGQ